MRSHNVTCHPAEMTFPPLPQPKLVLDLATPKGCKAELTWGSVNLSCRQQESESPSVETSYEPMSSPGELPSSASSALSTQPPLPPGPAVLQQQESVKRVGSVTHRMLSNPEPSCPASPQPADAFSLTSASPQGTFRFLLSGPPQCGETAIVTVLSVCPSICHTRISSSLSEIDLRLL